MTIMGQEKPSLDDLMHHGVKGMKWGVHNQKKLDRYNRVASGQGNFRDNYHMVSTIKATELVKHKGDMSKIAAERAAKLQARKSRIESGNANVGDKLDRYLSTPAHQLIRGR